MEATEPIVIPRAADCAEWMTLVDPSDLMNNSITWERVSAYPLTYMNLDGSGSTVVLAFSAPMDDDSAMLMPFMVDIEQVGVLCMSLVSALATVYGKTLDQVIEETKTRLRDGGYEL